MKQYEYEGRIIHPWHFLAVLLISFIALVIGFTMISLTKKYGVATFVIFSVPSILAAIGWLNFLFRKFVVEEDGFIHKRCLKLKLPFVYEYDWFYPFEDIKKIEVRGRLVNIKGKSFISNLGWLLIQNPEGFVEAVRKYAPEKLEVRR
jgi:hypothetical protein